MAVSKEHILGEIRRVAEDGGRPPGSQRFATQTGIRPTDWGRYWARWGDALVESGFQPRVVR